MYTMSFIRKIKRAGRVYLAEVENQWVNGKCVQRHIRYVGREADAGVWTFSAGLAALVELEPEGSGTDLPPGPHALGR